MLEIAESGGCQKACYYNMWTARTPLCARRGAVHSGWVLIVYKFSIER